jgi:hypothetical protein
LAPGTCSLCGSADGNDRKFIDFGKQLDWYGAVYFCSECMREVSEAIGYIPVDNFDRLHDSYRELTVKFDQLETSHGALKDAFRSLLAGHHLQCTNIDDFVRRIVSSVAESKSLSASSSESAEGNSASEQPASVEGTKYVLDLADLDDD